MNRKQVKLEKLYAKLRIMRDECEEMCCNCPRMGECDEEEEMLMIMNEIHEIEAFFDEENEECYEF